jgi:hypothetical protein
MAATTEARAVVGFDRESGRILAAHFTRSPRPEGVPDPREDRVREACEAAGRTVGVLHVAPGAMARDVGYRVDPATGALTAVASGGTKLSAGSHGTVPR